MLLLLARHGSTALTGKRLTGRLPGVHLSEEGKVQAEGLAERLAVFRLKGVYSSPLERCRETAEPVAARQRLPLGVIEGLGEIHYGDWQGKPYSQLYRMKRWSELQARPADFRFPNGETIREAQNRAMRAIEGVFVKHSRGAVLVVSHADLIRLIVAGYLGLSIDLYQRISVGVASVSAVVLGDRVPRLLRMGDTGSLDDLAARLKIPPKPASRRGTVRRLPSRPQAVPAVPSPAGAAAGASPAGEAGEAGGGEADEAGEAPAGKVNEAGEAGGETIKR